MPACQNLVQGRLVSHPISGSYVNQKTDVRMKPNLKIEPMKSKLTWMKNSCASVLVAVVAILLTASPMNVRAAAFTPGNLAVFSADSASANNTTFSIIEINATTAGQSAVQTISINGTSGANALRTSGSGSSTGYLSDSDDGTLVAFDAVNTTTSSGNVNAIGTRGVGTLNNSGAFTFQATYTAGTSGGTQARGASSANNSLWYVGDQDGIYTNGSSRLVNSNFRGVKSFGGTLYVLQSTTGTIVVNTIAANGQSVTGLSGLALDSKAQDFYLISSGNNGAAFDILYVLDETSTTAGTINKYSLVSGSWTANGSYATSFGGFGLCAAKSGSGAVLYVTTGSGATAANSVIKLNDTAGYNSTISITTGNNVTLYTGAAGTTLKGLAFAPIAAATYTVTYAGNGSDGGAVPTDASSPYASGATVAVLGNSGSLTKSGYNFAGWTTNADGSGTLFLAGNTFAITANTTLYANWTTLPAYGVTYFGNSNTAGTAPSDANSYVSNSLVTVLGPGNLARTGYNFTGWNTAANGTGAAYAPNAAFNVASNTALYAQWTLAYAVAYFGNGNTAGNPPADAGSPYNTGSTVTVLGNTGDLTRSGCTFAGWNAAADGTGSAYAIGSTFSIAAPVSLYAQWTTNPAITPGDLMVFSTDNSTTNNSTFSILEFNPATPNQSAPVQTIAINGATMPGALRVSGSATSVGYLADSDDGSLLAFAAANTNDAAATVNSYLQRGVGTLNTAGSFTLQTTYAGVSGNQTRGACSVDDTNWFIGDQTGLYTNGSTALITTNCRAVKSFGGTLYVLQTSTGTTVANTLSADGKTLTPLPGLTRDANATDYYLVQSGANGSAYDVLYTVGTDAIKKYSLVSGSWNHNVPDYADTNGFAICAATNASGVVLYVTTGTGGAAGNALLALTDTAGYNVAPAINTAANVTLYVATAPAGLKGVAFAPKSAAVTRPFITAIQISGGNVLIDFTGGAADVAGNFTVVSAATVNGAFAPIAATVTASGPGLFRATVPFSAGTATAFYGIRR